MIHDWRSIVPSNDPRHLKRGTEIELSCPMGEPYYGRFAIYTVRQSRYVKDAKAIDGGYVEYDVTYRVRDAGSVSDAQVRAGERPAIAFEGATLDTAEAFINASLTMSPTIV